MEGIRKPSTTVTKVMDPALSKSLTLLQLQKKVSFARAKVIIKHMIQNFDNKK